MPYSLPDLDALDEELKIMQRTPDPQDLETHMAAVLRFHRRLVEMSHSALFLRAWESMAWDVRARVAVKRIGVAGVNARQGYVQRRKRIVKALRSGDGDAAARNLAEITQGLLSRLAALDNPAARAA